MRLTYALITPARNEEQTLGQTIAAVAAQTIPPARWVIVDDGSTDRTAQLAAAAAAQYPWIRLVQRPPRKERHFAGKVHAVNAGLAALADLPYDLVGNLDADVSFAPDYMAFLLERFAAQPRLGVAGTPFTQDGYDSQRDSFEGPN